MADTAKDIRDVYRQGMHEIQKILGSVNSTQAQIDTASASLDDLTAMMLKQTIDTVQGRTALLSGLIVELNQVIESVKVKPPSADVIGNLTAVLDKAQGLFSEEKKDLL